jgi:hypothetical protein
VSNSRNWFKIAGLVLHVLIAALMIFASLGKLTGTAPAEVLESLRKAGLDGQLRLIGAGELITAIMLIVPWTASLGILGRRHMHAHGTARVVHVSVGAAGADLGRSVPAAPRDVQQLLADECLSLWEG